MNLMRTQLTLALLVLSLLAAPTTLAEHQGSGTEPSCEPADGGAYLCEPPERCRGHINETDACTVPPECREAGNETYRCEPSGHPEPEAPDPEAVRDAQRLYHDAVVDIHFTLRAELDALRAEHREGIAALRADYQERRATLKADFEACLAAAIELTDRSLRLDARLDCVGTARAELTSLRGEVRAQATELRASLLAQARQARAAACESLAIEAEATASLLGLLHTDIGAYVVPDGIARFCGETFAHAGLGATPIDRDDHAPDGASGASANGSASGSAGWSGPSASVNADTSASGSSAGGSVSGSVSVRVSSGLGGDS